MNKINVIIVDNIKLYRNSLSQIICRYKDISIVGLASSGYEYLLLAQKTQPDIALINIRLDTSDAFYTLELSRKFFPTIHTIAITFLNDTDTNEELKQAGFNGILTKDSSSKDIVGTIRQVYKQKNILNN
jgi:DNA-binding NarL/FixJ family response regulator